MYSLLLCIIYISFISLGLPDSLLGAGWPVMQPALGVPMSYAGIISMIIAGGTIVSSLLSDRLTRKLGAGLVTAGSVFLTAAALWGFSFSDSFVLLCLWAVPYGLGAGAVDAALNNYAALYFSGKHMSWLHCFWGVGASISPYIMSFCLTGGPGWQSGYRTVGMIQIVLTAVLFFSLPLWKKQAEGRAADTVVPTKLTLLEAIRLNGVKCILITFFGYCALESTAGLWASSYLAAYRGVDASVAARFASLFFLGITLGRFLCGFITEALGDRKMIRYGLILVLLGILLVFMPQNALALAGILIIGLGCAPIYPSIIHSTPDNFGAENAQAIVGIQMASAYVGSTFMPPVFGLLAQHISVGLYPLYLLLFAVLMLFMSEKLNKIV